MIEFRVLDSPVFEYGWCLFHLQDRQLQALEKNHVIDLWKYFTGDPTMTFRYFLIITNCNLLLLLIKVEIIDQSR